MIFDFQFSMVDDWLTFADAERIYLKWNLEGFAVEIIGCMQLILIIFDPSIFISGIIHAFNLGQMVESCRYGSLFKGFRDEADGLK